LQSPWERRLPACAKVAEWSLRPAQVGYLRTHRQAGSLRSQEKSDFAILLAETATFFTLSFSKPGFSFRLDQTRSEVLGRE
ncbi:MAG: hypothetical protein FWC43_07105, partial [Planctomycetaceae bacterium]|nr:hypothetical protein [Planctomycetaceae bacterium]